MALPKKNPRTTESCRGFELHGGCEAGMLGYDAYLAVGLDKVNGLARMQAGFSLCDGDKAPIALPDDQFLRSGAIDPLTDGITRDTAQNGSQGTGNVLAITFTCLRSERAAEQASNTRRDGVGGRGRCDLDVPCLNYDTFDHATYLQGFGTLT